MRQLDYRSSHSVLIVLGAMPFVIWRFRVASIWPDYFVIVYFLTAYLVLGLRVGYPGPKNHWYWKAILASAVLHCVVLLALTMGVLAIVASGIKPPTLMLFGLSAVILLIQSQARVRFFQVFSPKTKD